jgi:heptosyltransferase-2
MSDARRVIVRAPNWLGDAVMALPAMAAVRRALDGRTLIVAARDSIAPLFHEVTPVAPDDILTLDPAREAVQLRAARADAIVLFPNSFGSAWSARRAGIADRSGYRASARGLLLTRSVPRPRGRLHQIEYYAALARALGFDVPSGDAPRLEPSVFSRGKANALLESAGVGSGDLLVGFAPGAAYGHAKRWPPDRVAQVIAGLGRLGAVSVLVGAAADRETGRAIESTLPPGVRMANLIGRTSLRDLVGLIARCAAFVSNDSGAMHIAAALRVPLTAIFGPTDERATAPAGNADVIVRDVFCRPCMLRECPIDHRCMKRIDVDSVLRSVAAHLPGGARS